jgi:hypothetical protein
MTRKPKAVEVAEGKLRLLDHLARRYRLHVDVIAAAKVKVGADLADALSGELGQKLLGEVNAEVQRLEKGDLQPGDLARWFFGSEERVSRVIGVSEATVVVEFEGRNGGYPMNRADARVAPEPLEQKRELQAACIAVVEHS